MKGCINTLDVVGREIRRHYNTDEGMAIIGREMNDKEELEREEIFIEELEKNYGEYSEQKKMLEKKKELREQKLEKLKQDKKGE